MYHSLYNVKQCQAQRMKVAELVNNYYYCFNYHVTFHNFTNEHLIS